MKRTRNIAAAAAVMAALTLASCQDFFTSSFASWAQRDPSVPDNLSADQAMSIADQAVANCDTDLAQALLPQMADFLAGTPSDDLIEAAVDTAVLASGIGEAFGEALATIGTDVIEGGGSLTPTQLDTLAAILNSISITADAVTVFTYLEGESVSDMAAAGITAADYVMAAASLIVAEAAAQSIDLSDAIDTGFAGEGFDDGIGYAPLAINLVANASTLWPDDPLLDALTTMFDAL